jgi:hypothetical protein
MNKYKLHCLLAWVMLLHACALSKDTAPNDALPPQANTPQNLNHIARVAQNAGIVDCLGRLNQVSDFLVKRNPNNSVAFFMPEQNANDRLLSTSFEIEMPQALTYASTYFAPRGPAGCDGAYEAITYWQNTCEVIAKKNFVQLKRLGTIRRTILALDGGPQLRVFLMPAGKGGCVSIKKELIY